jgi:putative oxidoreductase
MKFPSFDALRPYTYALLRIGMALMFMQHGAQKLFGALGGFGQMGSVPIVSKFGLAGIIEFAGGLLIAVGILGRFSLDAMLGFDREELVPAMT